MASLGPPDRLVIWLLSSANPLGYHHRGRGVLPTRPRSLNCTPDMKPLEIPALQRLAKFDTPTVCNVIELWDIRPRNTGFMNGSIQACYPKLPPMVGYAVTSTFRSMAPPRSGDV